MKEQKETLQTKTLILENFQLAKAPKLNAEVASILDPSLQIRKAVHPQSSQDLLGVLWESTECPPRQPSGQGRAHPVRSPSIIHQTPAAPNGPRRQPPSPVRS
ncbi:unnamed protein product, partial [Iphiclides podalirius]